MQVKNKTLQNLLLNIVEYSHDIIWIIDTNLIVVYFNKAIEKYGWKRDNLIGKNILNIMDKQSSNLFKTTINNKFTTCSEKAAVVETNNFFNGTKNIFILESTCKVLHNNYGKIIGLYGISRDVTCNKQLEQITLEKEKKKMLVEVSGGICHEVSQPLQVMMGYIDLLDTTELSVEGKKYINNLHTSMNRLNTLVKKIQNIKEYKTRSYLTTKIIDLD